eukprot:TRINITY_DN12593_c0_g1_i1.p1 TRINITY_DN12593_c0_g1~~TRINITY_DN12593_c0_g1_i1.p1  ORF type:complete len:199 (+),score=52.83 TRINITY_DN12593_c0_g1_i1:110-706(+)
MKLVLGTSSKWRKAILEKELPGLVWKQISPDIDEKAVRDEDAVQLCLKVAEAKADKLEKKMIEWCKEEGDELVLLTADQVVRHGSEIREKPESEEENYRYLRSYTPESPLETCSALVLTHFPTLRRLKSVDIAKVAFNPIPEDTMKAIVAKGDTMQCCGGFTIEDLTEHIHSITGEMSSVQGLPVTLLKTLLKDIGYH